MVTSGSWRPQVWSTALLLCCVAGTAPALASDIYLAPYNQLTIPTLAIGSASYSNVVVKVGKLVSGPTGSSATATGDSYNPATLQLTAPAVTLGSSGYFNIVATVAGLVSIGSADGVDSYDGTHLTIPAVLVGNTTYNNVVITVGRIVGFAGGMPALTQDVYQPSSGTLQIPAVVYNGSVYTNVTVTVGSVISVGPGITGVAAAAGGPISSATVTLADAAGHRASAVSAADGSFSISTAGLTPPFLLSVASGGTTLYSFARGSDIANLNPYTTIALQAYYSALGTTVSAAFGAPGGASSYPDRSQLALLVHPFQSALQPYLAAAGVAQAASFNPFRTPFVANHTGFDTVLDRTVLGAGALSVTVDNGVGTTAGSLSSTLTVRATGGSASTLASAAVLTVTSNSTTGGTSSSQQLVPVGITAAQQTALANAQAGVLETFSVLGQLSALKGSALGTSDVAPFVDANFLDKGVTASDWLSNLAGNFSGAPAGTTVSFSLARVNRFNPVDLTLDATVELAFASSGQASAPNYLEENDDPGYGMVYRQQSGGQWAFYGQQTLFEAHVNPSGQRFYDANSNTPNVGSLSLNFMAQVSVAPGALSGAAVAGPANSLPDCSLSQPTFSLSSVTLVQDPGLYNGDDRFDLPQCQNTIAGSPPPAGTVYTFSLTEAGSGTVVQQTYPLDAIALDYGDITTINGESRASFAAGNTVGSVAGTTLTLGFTPPTTFPVLYSYITAFCQNASQVSGGGGEDLDNNNNLAANATSGSFAIPTQCSGAPIASLGIGVSFIGINGESVQVQQQLHN
jgi:hypothetical protein